MSVCRQSFSKRHVLPQEKKLEQAARLPGKVYFGGRKVADWQRWGGRGVFGWEKKVLKQRRGFNCNCMVGIRETKHCLRNCVI